ncbi:astakine-like isoform X3 [Pecten maximus]|uniref:astakine-like isoform X3 n=1 Tax=Pecten maximus TaxID=6579 RepID=UPI0014588AAB|nr:astakine-like isoform X3 [Pecten maximus]
MTFRPAGITLFLVTVVFMFVSAEDCTSASDCGHGECCVANNQPIGKRGLMAAGTCRPLGQDGSSCYARYIHTPPTGMEYACPCGPGLVCKGSGTIVVPIGESGTCGHH